MNAADHFAEAQRLLAEAAGIERRDRPTDQARPVYPYGSPARAQIVEEAKAHIMAAQAVAVFPQVAIP